MYNLLIAVITSSSLSAIVSAIINRMDKRDDVKNALMVSIGWQIREGCKSAIRDKHITMNELQQLTEMYNTYKKMGGNGFVATLMSKVEKLEIIEE